MPERYDQGKNVRRAIPTFDYRKHIGSSLGLQTRMFFDDEQEANSHDPILCQVSEPSKVGALIARQERPGVHRFDIWLQVKDETVFFDMYGSR